MDAGNINNIGPAKSLEVRDAGRVRQKSINAYAKTAADAKTDTVAVSSKAKLMHGLREKLRTLPNEEERVQMLKRQAEEKTLEMSPEEIVHAILKGSLFDVI